MRKRQSREAYRVGRMRAAGNGMEAAQSATVAAPFRMNWCGGQNSAWNSGNERTCRVLLN